MLGTTETQKCLHFYGGKEMMRITKQTPNYPCYNFIKRLRRNCSKKLDHSSILFFAKWTSFLKRPRTWIFSWVDVRVLVPLFQTRLKTPHWVIVNFNLIKFEIYFFQTDNYKIMICLYNLRIKSGDILQYKKLQTTHKSLETLQLSLYKTWHYIVI